MAGNTRKNKEGERLKHAWLLENVDVRRWYENLKAGSTLTAGVYLRGLGLYCREMDTTPDNILQDARTVKPLQDQFMDFVRMMERRGTKGAYISRYKKVLHSWTKHNGIEFKVIAKIRNENINERTQNETVFSQEELGRILRNAGLRGKTEIALMAYSGLRPRSISNEDGTDCLQVKDIPEMKIRDGHVEFEKEPVRVIVRPNLNKGQKHGYTTFLGHEGTTYLKEYMEFRISEEEIISDSSPIIQFDRNARREHTYLQTHYIEREIRIAIIGAGFYTNKKKGNDEFKSTTRRPYLLRGYFATGLDIAEQKGLVSHPWRQYWMGHSGDMESRYSTNKNLRDSEIEEMRQAYSKCLQYLETQFKSMREEEQHSLEKSLTGTVLMKIFGYSKEESERLMELSDDELQKELQKKLGNAMDGESVRRKAMQDAKEISKRKNKQVMIGSAFVEAYFEEGFEYVGTVGQDKVIMKLP